MSIIGKAILPLGVLLIILSLFGVLLFFSLSTISLVTGHISRYWNWCFLLNSLALGGWMIFYAAQLRIGGGVIFYRNNVLLFWFLVFTVLVSTILGFAGLQRYLAILILAASLAAFHVAVPSFLSAIWLMRKG
jgi:hypothetical protein